MAEVNRNEDATSHVLHSTDAINEIILKRLTEISEKLTKISNQCNDVKKLCNTHSAVLKRISIKIFPQSTQVTGKYNIFPIKSIQDLENSEEIIKKEPHEDIVLYIKQIVGEAPLSAAFPKLFTEDVILQVNWDGVKNKKAVRDYKLFHTMVFEAVKDHSFGYVQYENEMKKGFRINKSRYYRKTYKLKLNKEAVFNW